MKRKKEREPAFDEIIFEHRNKNYGAFDLRKRYNSTTTLSIFGAVFIFVIIFSSIPSATEEVLASSGPVILILENPDPFKTEEIPLPEVKPPPEMNNEVKYIEPEVVSDSTLTTTYIPITEELITNTTDGEVTEEVGVIETHDPVISTEKKPFVVVEEPVEFPGGQAALLRFINESIVYPPEAVYNNIQGRVILKFVVNEDGSADRIEILRGVDPLLDNEAIRVVKTLPKFNPGRQGGVPVQVWFTLPVVFRLEVR